MASYTEDVEDHRWWVQSGQSAVYRKTFGTCHGTGPGTINPSAYTASCPKQQIAVPHGEISIFQARQSAAAATWSVGGEEEQLQLPPISSGREILGYLQFCSTQCIWMARASVPGILIKLSSKKLRSA